MEDYITEFKQFENNFDFLFFFEDSLWDEIRDILTEGFFSPLSLESLACDSVSIKNTITFYCETFKEIAFSEFY